MSTYQNYLKAAMTDFMKTFYKIFMVKPRIKPHPEAPGWWICFVRGESEYGNGRTPSDAYKDWMTVTKRGL